LHHETDEHPLHHEERGELPDGVCNGIHKTTIKHQKTEMFAESNHAPGLNLHKEDIALSSGKHLT